MVAASSEKDHYLAFKRAKKLAKYIYKGVCSIAFNFTRPAIATPAAWMSDTGASGDLIGKEYIDPILLEEMSGKAEVPVTLTTANGSVPRLDDTVLMPVGPLQEDVEPLIVPNCPPLLSVGYRCMEKGWDLGGLDMALQSMLNLTVQ